MNEALILENLNDLGVTVTLVGPDRLRLEPAERIPDELKPRILEAKAEILAALSGQRQNPVPDKPCYACGSKAFWKSVYGVIVCWRCQPPANESLIADLLWNGKVKWRVN